MISQTAQQMLSLNFRNTDFSNFLRLSRKDILTHAGKISAKLAKEKADKEYDKFKERTKNELSPVEIHFLENFEREQKRLLGGKGYK